MTRIDQQQQQQQSALLRLLLLGDAQSHLHTHTQWHDALLEEHLIDDADTQQQQPVILQSSVIAAANPLASASPAADAIQPQPLLHAIDVIVPHLPDFHDVSLRVEALFSYCRHQHAALFDRLLRAWLQRRGLPLPFRAWLLQWLAASGVVTTSSGARASHSIATNHVSTNADDSNDCDRHDDVCTSSSAALLWQSALSAALLTEDEPALRQTLLHLLHELMPFEAMSLDDKHVSNSNANKLDKTTTTGTAMKITTDALVCSVDELLDMYIANAHALAPFSLLCATKLHALALTQCDAQLQQTASVQQQQQRHQQQRSSFQPLAPTNSVVVRLRWGKLLAPMFFDALLRHCAALQVFEHNDALGDAHAFVQQLVRDRHWNERSTQKRTRLVATADQLRRAYDANAAYVVVKFASLLAAPSPSYAQQQQQQQQQPLQQQQLDCSAAFAALPLAHQRVVLLELTRDLEDTPATLLPHVLVAFSVVVRALALQAAAASADALQHESVAGLHMAMRALVALVALPSDSDADATRCFILAAAVMELTDALQPLILIDVVARLNEQLAVETSASTRWLLRQLLQHVLFESDAAVVAQCLSALAASLPPQLVRLAQLRCRQL